MPGKLPPGEGPPLEGQEQADTSMEAATEVSESIPTPEEVQSVFEQLVGGEEFTDRRKLEDEQGLYLWEIIVSREDGDVEYSYARKGRHGKEQASATAIGAYFFNKGGIPISGTTAARYEEGKWRIIE
ncbi:MAG: hypothetical protein ABII72_00150 [Parcubacteria group bacterium]